MTKLSEAFKELCAVSRVRPDLAAGSIEDAGRRLWRVLGEYPESVALAALDQWPRQSEWFPAEKELRALLDELTSAAAMDAAQRGEAPDGGYHYPIGHTAALVERAKRIYGEDYCKSWLAGGITCIFTENRIFTTALGVSRLTHDLGAAMREMGVEAYPSAAASRMLAQYCETRGLTFEAKRGRAR